MNIITGYRGEPHITAQEDRDINLGVIGNSLTDIYVLNIGQMLSAEIVSANEIRIRDGLLVMQGCAASIDYGAYDSIAISNGAQGMQRIDIIAAQYEKDGDTNVETVSLIVIEGTPAASDPSAPTLTGGDIQGGDTLVQMPLYYVNIDGVSIDSVTSKFKMVDSAYLNSITNTTKTKWSNITTSGSVNGALNFLANQFSGSRRLPLMEYGEESLGSVPANGSTTADISFTKGFTSTPILITGYRGGTPQYINVSATGVSKTGATLVGGNFSATARSCTVAWLAIQA